MNLPAGQALPIGVNPGLLGATPPMTCRNSQGERQPRHSIQLKLVPAVLRPANQSYRKRCHRVRCSPDEPSTLFC